MINMPFISVIVPVYNGERIIGECIDSLLKQDYPQNKYEIIIVDNDSQDKTSEIIKKYPVRYIVENKAKGPYAARNEGVRQAKGEIIAFTDADCIVSKNWLYEINNSFINKDLAAVQGPGNLTLQKDLKVKIECLDREMSKNRFWGDTKNFAIRKEIFNELGGFEKFHAGEDGLLFILLSLKKYNIIFNENMLVYHTFQTTLFALIRKNWKHGLGDVFIAKRFYRLYRIQKIKEMLYIQPKKSLKILSLQVKPSEKIYMWLYYILMKEIRYLSYLINSFDDRIRQVDKYQEKHIEFETGENHRVGAIKNSVKVVNVLPSISIIVPVYNGEKLIGECIESLLNQDYPKDKYKIIIVDNNSRDKTAEIIKRYPVKYVMEDKIQSSYAARNAGIRLSKGDILAFTDADCAAHKDWLKNLIRGWDTEVFGFAGEIEEPEPETSIEKYHAGKYNQKHKLLESQYPCAMTANVAYKKDIFNHLGLFKQDLVSGGDTDFTRRVKQTGYQIRYNPDAKVIHKHRDTLKALYKQAKRYAFGKVVGSVTCKSIAQERLNIICNFLKSIVRTVVMIGYRTLTVMFKDDKGYYLAMPFIFIVESHAILQGKRLGLKYIKNKGSVKCPYE